MTNEEKYILLANELKTLYIEYLKEKNILQIEKEKKFSDFCDDLKNLYEEEKEEIYNTYVRPFVNQYPFLEEASSLQIIKKLRHENYHSLFLKHIWGSQNLFGSLILRDFLRTIGQEEQWHDTLHHCSYKEYEEVQTKGLKKGDDKKRIDLLFVDEKNKWCIVIENKIDSEVHYSGQNKKQSQLDYYRRFCEKEYAEYKKSYILLSYNTKNVSHRKDDWIYADYYKVFKSLIKYHSEDQLLKDYLKTLFKLLFPNETMADYENSSLYRGMQFYNNIISNIK